MLRSEDLGLLDNGQPEIRRVRAGSATVLVCRLESGAVVAFGSACPHQGTPLEEASLWDGLLRCRRHLYLYDPVTGENVLPARESPELLWKLKPGFLPVYRAEEHDGWIWVSEHPGPPPAAYDPSRERRPPPPAAEPAGAAATDGPGGPPVEEVAVTEGDEFDLLLEVAARPGHLWRLLEVSGGLVRLVGQEFVAGEPPRQRLRLIASAPGEQVVSFAYATPWDPDPQGETRRFLVRVRPRR